MKKRPQKKSLKGWRKGFWGLAMSGLALCLLGFLALMLTNFYIVEASKSSVHERIEEMPENRYALVLGTSRYFRDGSPNAFFEGRMDAAAALYEAGKVERLLVSGDNRDASYNEPEYMRAALVDRGVPGIAIELDGEGLSTYESLARAREVYGLEAVTIVSQRFHNYRAVFIAQRLGIEAAAVCADGVEGAAGTRVRLREWFARLKALIDVGRQSTRELEPVSGIP